MLNLPLDRTDVKNHLRYILGDDIHFSESQLTAFIYELEKLITRDQREKNIPSQHSATVISSHVDETEGFCVSHGSTESCLECCKRPINSEDKSIQTTITKKPISSAKSFIKPWKVGWKGSSSKAERCDPVTLHQNYQEYWKNFRLPGEDDRSKLRWSVRSKMLGQNPEPMESELPCLCECCKVPENYQRNLKVCDDIETCSIGKFPSTSSGNSSSKQKIINLGEIPKKLKHRRKIVIVINGRCTIKLPSARSSSIGSRKH